MQKIENVTFITKNYHPWLRKQVLIVGGLEIYPLGKAYGGRPFAQWTWQEGQDIKGLTVNMYMDEEFNYEVVLHKSFSATLKKCGCDPRGLDRVRVYKQYSDLEFVLICDWRRGVPIEQEWLKW